MKSAHALRLRRRQARGTRSSPRAAHHDLYEGADLRSTKRRGAQARQNCAHSLLPSRAQSSSWGEEAHESVGPARQRHRWIQVSRLAGFSTADDGPNKVIFLVLTGIFSPLSSVEAVSTGRSSPPAPRTQSHRRDEGAACAVPAWGSSRAGDSRYAQKRGERMSRASETCRCATPTPDGPGLRRCRVRPEHLEALMVMGNGANVAEDD